MRGAQPLVSVVIPVYNAAQYLPRVIGSVQAQTFPDWELILVDDGSTDDSGAVCDRYAAEDRRIRVIHTPNGGSSAARNAGMDAARGAWLFFIDNDDWVEPDALEKLLKHSQDADVVVGHYPEKQPPWRNVDAPRSFCPQSATSDELSEMFYLKLFSPVWNKLFRRASIAVPFDTAVSYIDDVTFLHANFPHWRRVVFIPENTYCYEQREGSLTHAFRIDRMEQVRQSLRLFSRLYPDGSAVMNTLSRWYAIELRMYLRHYTGGNVPDDVKRLMLQLWLEDGGFDHGRISTALMKGELLTFWEAVLRKDAAGILEILSSLS